LWCYNNQLTSLDVSGATSLQYLKCYNNQLTSLDVSNNPALTSLYCNDNQLTSLDVSANANLRTLYCSNNLLTSLDFSSNNAFGELDCSNNQLSCLNIKNLPLILWGGNDPFPNPPLPSPFPYPNTYNLSGNPNLTCIEVSDITWATSYFTVAKGNIDATASFSTDCNNPCSSATTGMAEHEIIGKTAEHSLSLNLYPNPVTSSLVVETRYPLQLAIYNVQGKLMVDRAISSTYTMNLSELARGIYFLTATDEQGKVYSQKVVKE